MVKFMLICSLVTTITCSLLTTNVTNWPFLVILDKLCFNLKYFSGRLLQNMSGSSFVSTLLPRRRNDGIQQTILPDSTWGWWKYVQAETRSSALFWTSERRGRSDWIHWGKLPVWRRRYLWAHQRGISWWHKWNYFLTQAINVCKMLTSAFSASAKELPAFISIYSFLNHCFLYTQYSFTHFS